MAGERMVDFEEPGVVSGGSVSAGPWAVKSEGHGVSAAVDLEPSPFDEAGDADRLRCEAAAEDGMAVELERIAGGDRLKLEAAAGFREWAKFRRRMDSTVEETKGIRAELIRTRGYDFGGTAPRLECTIHNRPLIEAGEYGFVCPVCACDRAKVARDLAKIGL